MELASPTSIEIAVSDPLVSKIPEEILVDIFSWLSQDILTARMASPWLPCAAVCRRWRDVICSNPRFWRNILVYRTPGWLTLSLDRCRGALADVVFLESDFPYSDLPTLLCDYVSCIRSLEFRHVLAKWDTSITALLTLHRWPVLERLTSVNKDDSIAVGLQLSPAQLPRLKSLVLSRFIVPGSVTLLRSLCSMSIHHAPLSMSFRDFMSTLHENTKLQELSFSDSWEMYGGTLDIPSPHTGSSLDMTRLRKFTLISGSQSILFHVLHNLRIPNAIDVSLLGKSVGSGFVKDGSLFRSCLFPASRPPTAIFPMLDTMSHISLHITDDEGILKAKSTTHRIELRLTDLPVGKYFEASVRDVIDIFTAAPISQIDLTWTQDEDDARGALWPALLYAFPHLDDLRLCGFGGSDDSWFGLYDALASPVDPSKELACPQLKNLVVGVIYVVDVEDLVKALHPILNMLRCRAERGSSKLDELELELEMEHDNEDITMREVYLPRFKELVTAVRYERYIH